MLIAQSKYIKWMERAYLATDTLSVESTEFDSLFDDSQKPAKLNLYVDVYEHETH